jgi:hypothetical protein
VARCGEGRQQQWPISRLADGELAAKLRIEERAFEGVGELT